MKIRVNSSMYIGVTKGHVYTIYAETKNFYLVIDDVGGIIPIRKEDCEIVEETSWHWFDEPSEHTMYNRTSGVEFEPIKSEKEKEIEELDKHLDEWFDNIILYIDDAYDGLTLPQYLYSIGYRKTQQ